jgi:hypothetical protein
MMTAVDWGSVITQMIKSIFLLCPCNICGGMQTTEYTWHIGV